MGIVTLILIYGCLAVVLANAIKLYVSRRKYVNKINLLPGMATVWPFGNVLPFLKISVKEYGNKYVDTVKQSRELGCLTRWWIFHVPYVAINSAEAAEALLKSNETHKSIEYDLFCRWLGRGLITSSGRTWQIHRKMLTRSFHFEILESFMSVFNEQSDILVKQLGKKVGPDEFNVFPYLTLCALDVVCESAMGRKLHAQTSSDCEYVTAVHTLSEVIIQKIAKVWLQIPWIYKFTAIKKKEDESLKIVHNFINEVIREKREERKRAKAALPKATGIEPEIFGKKPTLAFLDTIMEAIDGGHGYLDDEQIREECDTFMFAGHDTTASALTSTVMNLGMFPEVQDKVVEEMNSIFDGANRDVTYEDLTRMKYLEAVIKESLRLYPPVPLYGRILQEDLKVESHTIPKDTRVFVLANTIHRDPKLFPNPNEFDPTRFLVAESDQARLRHPFAFLAFSAGTRNCIGQRYAMMEMKTIITHMVRNYRIIYTRERKEYKMSPGVVAGPRKGLIVRIEPRVN